MFQYLHSNRIVVDLSVINIFQFFQCVSRDMQPLLIFEPKKDTSRFEEYFARFDGNQTKLFNYLTDGKYASGPPKTPKQRRQFNKKQKLHQGSLGTILEDENAITEFTKEESSEDED